MFVGLSLEIHELTRRFSEGLFMRNHQIKRTADRVSVNIAEDSALQTPTEFKRFLKYANQSAREVETCLYIGRKKNLIDHSDFNRLYMTHDKLVTMIQSLIRSLA